MKIFLLILVLGVAACSAKQTLPKDEMGAAATDSFNDPFFTQSLTGDDWAWQRSESAAEKPEEPEKPRTMLEQSEGVVFSTLLVGASLAKMLAVPFLF